MQTETAKWPVYYPELEVEVFAPNFYFSMEQKRGEYSKHIVLSKKSDFSDYFFEALKDVFKKLPIRPDTIVIIPSSKMGRFSPTVDELGRKLSNFFGITYRKIIKRIKEGKKLTSCSSCDERYTEIAGSFKVLDKLYGQNVVLLDDTRTTGMTILECAQELKKAGASEVVAVCLGINKNQL